MKYAIRTAIAFTSLCLCSGADAKIVTFRMPNYASGIEALSINDKGQVTGVLDDANARMIHGFLWQKSGGLTVFDAPAPSFATQRYNGVAEMTIPTGITTDGTLIGNYADMLFAGGFIRAADGSIRTFSNSPPGHSFAVGGTNRKGWIVGAYWRDAQHQYQPFLEDPSGAIKDFSVPGIPNNANATVVNLSRAIGGNTLVAQYPARLYQGFFRSAHGKAALFGQPHNVVSVAGINDAGTITGSYRDTAGYSAFVRTSDGRLKIFVGPNGATDTQAFAINNSGTIVGGFTDASGKGHGFIRTADGTFTPFDIDGAYGTGLTAINDKGMIAGGYSTKDGHFGFAGKP